MKIAILGAGNMGGSIARGLAKGDIIKASEITITAKTEATLNKIKADLPEINTTLSNLEACQGASIVMLCVKPWLVQQVLEEVYSAINASNPLIINVAAGITFEQISQMMAGEQRPVARVIPNTAVAIGKSPTLICFNSEVSQAQQQLVCAMFDQMGQSFVIDEAHMAAGTAITSCGIAFALQYIKAAVQGAIELGFYPHVAKQMIDQTIEGATGLLEANGTMPDTEIYKVCTPGGITIKGINEMIAKGFDDAVISGLRKSAGK